MPYESRFFQIVAKAACAVLGESMNVLLAYIAEKLGENAKDLACLTAAVLGLLDGNHRIAQEEFECLNLNHAFRVKQGEQCDLSAGIITLREEVILPKLDEILGPGGLNAISYMQDVAAQAPDEIIEAIADHRGRHPYLQSRDIRQEGDYIVIELCYTSKELADKVMEIKNGGLITNFVAIAYARTKGYEGVRFLRKERRGDKCVLFLYEPVEKAVEKLVRAPLGSPA